MSTTKASRYTCIAAVVALSPALAAAQEPDTDVRDSGHPIDSVTIIGHQSDVADVPGSAHIVSAADLEVFLDADILRVLRSVPGVYVQEEDGFGLRPNIGIRGSGLDRSARIALLEDGVLIAPAPYSAPSAYYFPTQRRMSAIEVLKGPAAVAVGPRTTGGAINLISTPIPETMALGADIRGGAHGTRDAHLHAGSRGERFAWLLETVQAQSDGFKTIDGPIGGDTGYDIRDYVAKFRIESDPARDIRQNLQVKFGYTDHESSETYLGLTDADFQVNPNRRYAASANDDFQSEHEQLQATYVFDPGNSWRSEITVYRNEFSRNWYKLQSVAGVGLSDVLADPVTYATELATLQGASSADDALRIRANKRSYDSRGVQGRIEWDFGVGESDVALNAGFRLHDDEEDRFQHEDGYRMDDNMLVLSTAAAAGSQTNRISSADARAVFVDAEIRRGKWIFTPGIRHESIDLTRLDYSTSDPTRSNGPTRERKNSVSVVIPGIGAMYRLNSDWRLLAGIHKGFNPPAPGSDAREETSVNFEAGTRFDNDKLSFEVLYFLNDYDNLVGTVTDSTGGGGEIGDQFDGGEVRVEGLELSAAYGTAVGALEVPLSVQYTWTAKAEFENAFASSFGPWGDVRIGDELPYIPEHQFRAMAGLKNARFNLNLAVNYVSKMRSGAEQGPFIAEDTIESHLVWDFVAAWNFTPSFATYFKVDNLFDEVYVASRRPAGLRPGLPRTAYIGLSYRL